ncbi:MAG: TonB-dependent receptor [Saprospiraceae bacterium]|nr:TonB-dependent receptor [Saprospiraceae bacterium]
MKSCYTCIILFLSFHLQAQSDRVTKTISGTVVDATSSEALPFATIICMPGKQGTTSNVDGQFTLFEVSDTATLLIQYLGYENLSFALDADLVKTNLEIRLKPEGELLSEVVVKATAANQILKASSGVSRIGVSPANLAKLPSFGEKDIFRSLQLLPGISGTQENSAGLFVRGGTPDQNLILFDGFTVYHVDHLFGFFSAFNSNAIKDVQLHKGGFGAQYGGRTSSVVELTGKDGNKEEFNMGLGLSLLSYNAIAEAPLFAGKGSLLIAGRRSFQSSFYTNLFESFTSADADAAATTQQGPGGNRNFGQQQFVPNSYFYDLNAKLSYRADDKNVFALSFYNGEDDLDNSRVADQNSFRRPGRFGGGGQQQDFSFSSTTSDLTNWGNWGAGLKWSRQWSDRFYSNANLSYSNYFSIRDRTNETTIMRADTSINRNTGTYEENDLRDHSIKLDNRYHVSSSNVLEFGFQHTINEIKYDFLQNDTISVLDRLDQGSTSSLYFSDRVTIANKLILTAGLRSTWYSITEALYFEPRLSFSYLLSDRIKFKGAWGDYNQFATRIIREDIQQGSRDFWLLADDETVPISSATHYILGASYETDQWLLDLEGYYKKLTGLSEYTTRLATAGVGRNRTLNYEEFFYTGTGTAKGLEVLLQKKRGRLTGWLSYTLGEVLYEFEAFSDQPFHASQDQTHEFKAVATYDLGRFSLSGTFVYASGRPYTAPTGYYNITLLDGSEADFFEISDKNGLRLPDYHRLDLSASYEADLWGSKAEFGLSFFNVYDRANIWYKEYEVVEGALFETNISLLDFTPSLFITWNLK